MSDIVDLKYIIEKCEDIDCLISQNQENVLKLMESKSMIRNLLYQVINDAHATGDVPFLYCIKKLWETFRYGYFLMDVGDEYYEYFNLGFRRMAIKKEEVNVKQENK